MKKIPSIFLRDFGGDPRKVKRDQDPRCDWVFAGEGVATRKYDGTCCMFDGTAWWKRREVRGGKPDPEGFVFAGEDGITGKRVGWVPVGAGDRWHHEGASNTLAPKAGTYELCGPRVNGNPEGFDRHIMVSHAAAEVIDAPRSYDALANFMNGFPHEGVVFHHPDGRMAKIKRKDF